jgi:hypothetical protein
VPGPFLLHAVGLATDVRSRAATENGLSSVRAAAQSADIGRSVRRSAKAARRSLKGWTNLVCSGSLISALPSTPTGDSRRHGCWPL